ncbi:MAG: hypothetical protein JSU96_15055 [Acidobacteriota bacterium]|nr:MAG: hypothetical protein JSU96_15055 [Acidobacteriota bacterium]
MLSLLGRLRNPAAFRWPITSLLFFLVLAGFAHYQLINRNLPYPDPAEVESLAPFQLSLNEIQIPLATEEEAVRKRLSVEAALRYLEQGNEVWRDKYRCVGCHMSGSYMLVRPALTSAVGKPPDLDRKLFLGLAEPLRQDGLDLIFAIGHNSAQLVYVAAGLAEWDANVTGELSPETAEMLNLMFRIQLEHGAWVMPDCWPPLQSSPFQLASLAAIAVGTAPTWLDRVDQPEVARKVELLREYLRSRAEQHDYERVWLLWASSRFPGLLESARVEQLKEMVLGHQHPDGGWALRDFARPSEWGGGVRKSSLEAEEDYASSPSDGHMTGLAVISLVEAGLSIEDPAIRAAVGWLVKNQRESGRWWARSLNGKNGLSLITYSATCYAILALERCRAFPRG